MREVAKKLFRTWVNNRLEWRVIYIGFAVFSLIAICTRLEVSATKDWVQTVFLMVGSILATLTYVNARSGVLQPLRTEVFKKQIEAISIVQQHFGSKSELELRDDIFFMTFVEINASKLLEDFSKVVLKHKYIPKNRNKNVEGQIGYGWRPLNPGVRQYLNDASWFTPSKSEAERREFWNSYCLPGLAVPKEMNESREVIRRLSQNPFLPSRIAKSIEEYLRTITQIESLLIEVLIELVVELPARYTDAEQLQVIIDGTLPEYWIYNKFNSRLVKSSDLSLKNAADRIIDEVRKHLGIDQLKIDQTP